MDPEIFRTPWRVIEIPIRGNGWNMTFVLEDKDGVVVGIIASKEQADFIAQKVNAFFEGF